MCLVDKLEALAEELVLELGGGLVLLAIPLAIVSPVRRASRAQVWRASQNTTGGTSRCGMSKDMVHEVAPRSALRKQMLRNTSQTRHDTGMRSCFA